MNESYIWYQELIKPTWAPPAWVFGPVWTFLYLIIILSFGFVVYKYIKGQVSFMVLLPFILNILFNLIFTPIQFGLRSLIGAAIDIILVLITLICALISIYPGFKWVSLVNIPYLLWVSFATILQFTITFLNLKK